MIYGQRTLEAALADAPTWMWEEEAQQEYQKYLQQMYEYNSKCYKFEGHDPDTPDSFAEWLKRSGIRLL